MSLNIFKDITIVHYSFVDVIIGDVTSSDSKVGTSYFFQSLSP